MSQSDSPMQIEQWCEHHYPSFVHAVPSPMGSIQTRLNPSDARVRALQREKPAHPANNGHANGNGFIKLKAFKTTMSVDVLAWLIVAFAAAFGVCVGIIYMLMWYLDVRRGRDILI
jgi:hypothetical protein